MEHTEQKEELPPPPPEEWEHNSIVDFESSSASSHERSFSGSISLDSIISSFTPTFLQRKKGTIEESTQDFHDKSQRFLRQAARSPRAETFKTPGGTTKRKSFQALPAIHDEDVEIMENRATSKGESLVLDRRSEADSEIVVTKLKDPLGRPVVEQDYLYGSVGRQAETESSKDVEEKLEHKLRQMLERHSTKPSEKQQFIKEYMFELHKERESLVAQWKSEFEQGGHGPPRSSALPFETVKKHFLQPCIESIVGLLSYAEVFISNLPLTIGAVALAWVTMGVVWFKFVEENIASCVPVHYHSPLCSFPEFPGCFECDTTKNSYQVALFFHSICTTVAGTLAIMFLFKVAIAWRVVADDLSNPATATPFGVICITLVCVFAGRGPIGEGIVLATSFFHFCFAFWFLYMAIVIFRTMPDPSWFPSTIGISYAAIKTWLYYPVAGKVLLAVCAFCFLAMFFVSVIRVALSKKIAAPVCWIQLSGPSITLYALTIMAQPSRQTEALLEGDSSLSTQYHDVLHRFYMPVQHFMFFLSLVGCVSAVHSLYVRWPHFREKEFSPAHVAFCFPSLSHTNAVQAYRGAVDAFSGIPPGSPYKVFLFSYWLLWLIGGTALNLVFTYKFLKRLPKWTKIDTFGETEPPEPDETLIHEMLPETHDILDQPFVSPAVLQANEAGALIRVRRGTEDFQRFGPYRRTRQVKALGFDPTLDDAELRQERAALLDWVAKNAPRTRHRTLSIPMMMKLKQKDGHDVYGSTEDLDSGRGHTRAQTMSDAAPWV